MEPSLPLETHPAVHVMPLAPLVIKLQPHVLPATSIMNHRGQGPLVPFVVWELFHL